MSHERLDGLERGLDEASRRAGFALVVSAVVIGSSLLASAHFGPHLGGVPLIGIAGFVIAAVIGLAWAVSALRPRKPRRGLMSDPPFGKSVRWLVALLLALPAGALLGQGATWVVKPVHGYRIALAVESIFAPARPGADPRHARSLEHRLLVSIREGATGRAAPIATVTVDVAESGYSGTTIALVPVRSGEEGLFEGRVRLSTANAHRILIHATPAGDGRTLEAQFEYRHHH